MQSVSNANFGTLIAYLVPGATVLFGASFYSPALSSLVATAPNEAPTIGGFLYLTLASLAVGMIQLLGHHDAYDPNYNSTQPAAVRLLTAIGPAAVPALREALRDKNPEVRELAQQVLQRIEARGEEAKARPGSAEAGAANVAIRTEGGAI
jgi:hypothetical protein